MKRKDWEMLGLMALIILLCVYLMGKVMLDCRRSGGIPVRGVTTPIECIRR